MSKLNLILIHSHDTGRAIQPYGWPVETPHLQEFAERSTVFRRCFSAAPTCSPSRAAMLTGVSAHASGMLGLAHLGWKLTEPKQHVASIMAHNGYRTALCGVHHESCEPFASVEDLQYHHLFNAKGTEGYANRSWKTVTCANEFIENTQEPFFLNVGLQETHRGFCKLESMDETKYIQPPMWLPDTPETRIDMARFRRSVKLLDQKIGSILDTLKRTGKWDQSVVIITTDHGMAYPWAKTTCSDQGLSVLFMVRHPKRGHGVVRDELISHLDVLPTIQAFLDLEIDHSLDGHSLEPLFSDREQPWDRPYVFSEQNFHTSYEPIRTVRNDRYRYTKRFDVPGARIPNHLCGSESRDFYLEQGWADGPAWEEEELYDCFEDPMCKQNLIHQVQLSGVKTELRSALHTWQTETQDPILSGSIIPTDGAIISDRRALTSEEAIIYDAEKPHNFC